MSVESESRVMEIQKFSAPAEATKRLTQHGSLAMAQVEPRYLELTRFGRVYVASGGVVANAVAPVTDCPTTAAAYALYNGYAANTNRCLVPLLVTSRSSSGTMGLGAGLMVGVTSTVQASAVANGTGVVLGYAGGSTAVSTSATLGSGVTLAAAPAWITVASVEQPAAVQLGAAMHAWLDGLFIVRPGCCLGITVLAPAGTTAKYTTDVIWAELQMDLV